MKEILTILNEECAEVLEKVKEALEEKIKRDFNVKIGEYPSDESKSDKKVMETKGAATCST